jgi:alcohol dehydrogenase class IV
MEDSKSMTLQEATGRLTDLLQSFKKVFLVSGGHSYVISGAKSLMDAVLSNKEVTRFNGFANNPNMDDVKKGVALLQATDVQCIIAIGGGSVMDMAKLVRHYSDKYELPIIAIPTTAGTGAEVTHFAVCYIDGAKQSIADSRMRPEHCLLVPELTLNNNKYLTACTGFDALAQSIEAFWNINATSLSDQYAEQALQHLLPALTEVVVEGKTSINNRDMLLYGAMLSGEAINITKTTAPHAVSYTLTTEYGYPHGHAVALTFPFFFDYFLNATVENYCGADYDHYKQKCQRLLEILHITKTTNLQHWMRQLRDDLGLGYNSALPFVDDAVIKGVNLERAKNSPCHLNESIIAQAVVSIRE